MCRRLETVRPFCPNDFSRKPRSLDDFKDYKATEFRQFLLYIGVIVLRGIIPEDVYLHFLFLSAAIRCLTHKSPSHKHLYFAQIALETFILRCETIFYLSFISYNVHALQHLVQDVKRFGLLDTFSAFPYENNMRFFRKFYRKPDRPLQQYALRSTEKKKWEQLILSNSNKYIKVFERHATGPLPTGALNCYMQYKKIRGKNMFLGLSLQDSCCILNDSSICVIKNILQSEHSYYLVVQKYSIVENLYEIGVSSSFVATFKCSLLSPNLSIISFNEVTAKCYRMPYWQPNNCDSSDSSDGMELDSPRIEEYIVSIIL